MAMLLEHVPAAVALLDNDMRYLAYSRRWLSDYGIEGQDIIGRSHYEVFPEIGEEWREFHRRGLAGETVASDLEAFKRADASIDWIKWKIVPWRDRSGEIGGIVLFTEVVTEFVMSVQANANLIAGREALLRSVLSSVPDAMVVIDDQGVIVSFSESAERLCGYPEAEALGQNVSMLMTAPDHAAHDGYLARYHATGERHMIGKGRRVIGRRKDGTTFPFYLSIGEAKFGNERYFTGFMRDLTEREKSDARVLELQSELLHVARVSVVETLATSIAHELNQPLAVVASLVQASHALLEVPDEATTAIVREALAEAAAEALRAGQIVRNLRNFVVRGEVEMTNEPVAKLIDDSRLLAFPGAGENGISCHVVLQDSLGSVRVGRVQVQQVLVNLIRNAVDAMAPQGRGEVRITASDEGEFARITVADNGPGLAPGIMDQLFQAFVTTKHDGMGLGLSICRTIVEAHGGRIWAESPPAGGVEFHFTLPRDVTGDDIDRRSSHLRIAVEAGV